jgi:hypothetical protein
MVGSLDVRAEQTEARLQNSSGDGIRIPSGAKAQHALGFYVRAEARTLQHQMPLLNFPAAWKARTLQEVP